MEQLSSGKAFNLKALLSKIVAEGKISYSQNLVLTDQRRTVPTSSGLPLTVSLNGSMAAQLKVLGSVDFGQAFDKPRSLHLNGALKPSGVLRVSASMMVDAMVTRTALRMTGTLHTNTIVKGRAHLDRGKMVNVELDLPRDNMTILDARTEMTFILGNEERALALTPGEEHELQACTGQQGVRLTGLDLCGKVQMPKSITSGSVYGDIVSNPSSVSLVLHKRDTLSQYKLFAQHLMTKHSLTTQLTISTPKSSVDRTLDLCVDVNLKQRQMELRMVAPWNKLALTGSLTSTPKKKEAQLTLALDETVTHGVTAAVTVRKDKLGVTYIPVVELRHFDTGPMTLSGVVSVGKFQRKVTAEVALKGVLDFVPSLKGSLTNSRKEVSMRGTISLSPGSSCSIAAGTFIAVSGKQAGKMELTPFFFINTNAQQLISLSGKGDYRQARSIRADVKVATVWTRPVSFKCTLARSPTRNQIHYRFDTEYKSSSALVSIDARADVKKMQMLLTRLSVSHDIPDLLPRDTVSMVTKLGKRSKAKYWNSFLQSSFQSRAYSQHNFDVKLHTEFEPTNSRVNMHYGYGADPLANNQYVTLTSKMRHDVKSLGNMDLAVRATAEIPSEKVKMELKASHSHSGRGLETKVIINSGKGQQTKAHLILINKSNGYLLIVGRATLVLPQSQDKLFSSSRKRKSRKIPADFQMQIKVTEKDECYEITTGAHSGKRKKDFSAVLSIKKPVSHRRLQMYCKGNPYSKTYQEFEAEISHAMHPLLADIVEAVLTRDLSELDLVKPFRLLTSVHGAEILQNDTESAKDLNGYANPDLDFNTPAYSTVEVDSLYTELLNAESIQEDDERSTKMNIKGGLDIKSTFIDLMSNSWNFAHTYTGSWHKTDITLADNGDNYAYEMSTRDNVAKWLEHSGGKIIISTPEKKLAAELTHEYDGSTIRTTCLTSWSKHRQILINLSGRVGKSNQTQALFGDILLKSPWKPLKDFRASLAHDTGRGLLRSKSTFRLNGVIRASHQVTFVQTSIFTDAGVMMVTPWTKKVTGSVIVQHGFYPMTCTAEVSWNPRHRASVTGTVDLQTWDEVQISLNVKTTVKTVKRISAEVVNKVDGENLVSEIKAHTGLSLHETNVDVRTALKDANVSYHFHSRGLPANLSGDMQLKVNDKQFFRTQVKHVHNEHILHSAVSCQNNNINNVTVVLFYDRNKLIVDASTFYNGTFDFNGSYTNHFDREDTRTVYVTVGANSFQTGTFKSSTNITFSEANGSWALTNLVQPEHGIDERHRSYSAHGVFYWDADRDVQKQLAVTTLLAAGDTRSADVAVSIPILSQTIRLKSDLGLEVRDVIWNSTTSLNLSPDPSKTLTFSTAMVMTPGPTEGINYTMTTFLTQPSSFVDVGMVSAAFGSSSELSTSLNGWFLTTEKTMQKVLLTGTYDRLKKHLEVMMVTPTRNASVTTELSSGKSYKLEAVGRTTDAEDFENNKELGLYVSLDPFHRSFLVKVNRDAGDSPSNYVAVEACYVNDSAIRAEVYRPHVTGSKTDSALSIWLNSSTLLHVDLSWRPLLTQELQVLAQETATRLNEYHTQLTHAWTQASQSIRNQIIQKWEAMKSQSVEELQPSIDLMLRELGLLHQLKNNVLRDLDDAFRINSDVKEMLVQLLDEASEAVRHGMVYTRSSEAYQRAAELVSRSLTKVRRSEIAYLYTDFLDRLPLTLAMAKRQSRERLQEVVHYINMYSLLVKKHMAELGNTLYSLRDLDIDDISEMFEGELLWQNLQNVGATAEVWLAPLSNTTYFLTANEFYQQGSWLYGYLNLDYHLDPHLDNFAESLKNIIMAEMRFRSRHIRFLQRSRVTVWEPQRGKIQAEVCLPFPVRSLWTLPHLPNGWTPARERAG
ncbi:hypothetical protein ACOMHN_015338 [Nucella lapillus]